MISRRIKITNLTGLYVISTGKFCDVAVRFKSSIKFKHDETTSNAKSILSVLGSGIKMGDEIELICEGEDEEEAMKEMVQVIESKLD